MTSLIIRKPQPSDETAWRELWRAYLEFYDTTISEEIYQNTWQRFFIDAIFEPNCLLAEHEGRLVGLVHFMQHRHNWRIENVVYLQDLFVAKTSRGTGAGRALIEAVYHYGDENGCPNVYWLTQDFNATARNLYDRVAKVTPFIRYVR